MSWHKVLADRNLAIVAAVKQGRTCRDVAKEHGISAGRAQQIVWRHHRQQAVLGRADRPILVWLAAKQQAHSDVNPSLFMRLRWFCDGHAITSLDDLCAWTEDEIFRMPNIGRQSTDLLLRLLAEDGRKLEVREPRPWHELARLSRW
jgi:hypothetical protein